MNTVWIGERIDDGATFVLASSSYDDARWEAERLVRTLRQPIAVFSPSPRVVPPACPYTLRVYDASGAVRLRREYTNDKQALDDAATCFPQERVAISRGDNVILVQCYDRAMYRRQ